MSIRTLFKQHKPSRNEKNFKLGRRMAIGDAIEVFLRDRKIEGRSKETLRSYACHLRGGQRYGVEQHGKDSLICEASEVVEEYIEYRSLHKQAWDDNPFVPTQERELSRASVAVTFRTWKAFMNRIQKLGYIQYDENPFALDLISCPKEDELIPRYLSQDEIELVHEILKKSTPDDRNVAMYLLLLDTGLRIGAVLGATVGDLDMGQRILLTKEKGGRDHQVTFLEATAEEIQRYLQSRPNLKAKSPLFATDDDKPLSYAGARMVFRKAFKAAEIDFDRCGPHVLRHTFARHYLLRGGDLATLSQELGHSSVTITTKYYGKMITADLQRKHDQFSPVQDLVDLRRSF